MRCSHGQIQAPARRRRSSNEPRARRTREWTRDCASASSRPGIARSRAARRRLCASTRSRAGARPPTGSPRRDPQRTPKRPAASAARRPSARTERARVTRVRRPRGHRTCRRGFAKSRDSIVNSIQSLDPGTDRGSCQVRISALGRASAGAARVRVEPPARSRRHRTRVADRCGCGRGSCRAGIHRGTRGDIRATRGSNRASAQP